jgi:hypothetical protein
MTMSEVDQRVPTDAGGRGATGASSHPDPTGPPTQPTENGAAGRSARRRPATLLTVGGLFGLAWAASLRGWMAQVAGADSSFDWTGTFALILLPGALLGCLVGWAEHLRRHGALHGARRRWLVASPLVFAAALADPAILTSLVTNGQGSGALAVAVVGLCGGYALGGRGPVVSRVATGLVALLLIAAGASIGPSGEQSTGAHVAWMAVHITTLLAVLCLACSIAHRPDRPA